MHKYVIRRLLLAVPVLVLASLIVFGLMRVMPGDALTALVAESGNVSERELAKLRRDLGLDKPYYQQYLIWMWQMVSLNPGYSIFTNEPIAVALKKSIPPVAVGSAPKGVGNDTKERCVAWTSPSWPISPLVLMLTPCRRA